MGWKKVLYEDQKEPDNFVDSSFLKSRKTVYRKYKYKDLVYSASALLQQFCVVTTFILVWLCMSEGLLTPETVLFTCIPSSGLCYIVYLLATAKEINKESVAEDCKTAILLLTFAGLSSPILKTLTHTISTDTVYTMTAFMLIGHFIFHDYGSSAVLVSRSVSLNMAIFAAVCLASRLESNVHTYATIVLALQLFGLWPVARRRISEKSPNFLRWLTGFLFCVLFSVLLVRNTVGATVFAVASVSINFLFPGLFVLLQSQKGNIYGPWDEAVISD